MIRNQHPSPRSAASPAAGRRPSAKSQSQIEPISLAKTMLRKWGLLAGMLGLVLAGGAVALTIWLFEPQYEARQYVVVNPNAEYTEIDPQGPVENLIPRLILDANQAPPGPDASC